MTKFLKLLGAGTAALALVFAIGAPAYAQNIEGSAILNAEVDATLDDSVEIGMEGNAGTSLSGDSIVEVGSGGASDVETSDDFKTYTATTLESHEGVESIDATDDSVTVGFVEEAQLFGFIPVSLNSRVVVHADGSVKVVRPWYSMFAIKTDAYQSTELEAEVAALLDGARTADGMFTARGKAMVTERIVGSLSGEAQVSGSAAGGTVLEGSKPLSGVDVSAQ